MAITRKTLSRPTAKLVGIGLHTGKPSSIAILPNNDSNASGLYFLESKSGKAVLANINAVVDTRRCTVLDILGERLSTVEHVMSALSGMGITDALIEFDGPEVPILDGSAIEFVRTIEEAGVVGLESAIEPIVVTAPVYVNGPNGECIAALPSNRFEVAVVIDYPKATQIGAQAAVYSGETYATEIAPARTYGFLSELEQVRALGLAGGVSLQNCVALLDDGSADERTPLRFSNELARHKLLDVIGDLSLGGRPIQGRVVALRPSHAVNCDLARQLAAIG